VPPRQIEAAFDLRRQLRNVDKIFARVFPELQAEMATKPRPKRMSARGKGAN
jgi:hypothetical protein